MKNKILWFTLQLFCVLLLLGAKANAHKQHVHQYIAREAYFLLRATLGGVEIPDMAAHLGPLEDPAYIGTRQWEQPYITTGAWREDEEDVVFGLRDFVDPFADGALISITHFWDADNGDESQNVFRYSWNGITGEIGPYPNAFQKMKKYAIPNRSWILKWLDGNHAHVSTFDLYGGGTITYSWFDQIGFEYVSLPDLYRTGQAWVVGYYDDQGRWIDHNIRPDILPRHVVLGDLPGGYREKLVWEILGRMCHLVADMAVPAHAHRDEHGLDPDSYENWVGGPSRPYLVWNWQNVGNYFENPYAFAQTDENRLHYLMYPMQEISDHFGSNGPYDGEGNDIIGGNPRSYEASVLSSIIPSLGPPTSQGGPFTTENLTNILNKTFPRTIRTTAGLLYWFAIETGLYVPLPPTITSISPDHVTVGSPSFDLYVFGSNLTPGSIVRWNGLSRPTTFFSLLNTTWLCASIEASDITSVGTATITVHTPSLPPTVLISNPATFTIVPPVMVTVDQRRESNEQLTGTKIGLWNGASFVDYTIPSPPLTLGYSSYEILRGRQDVVANPNEKYNRWVKNLTSDDPDVRNHHRFMITSDINTLTSQFKQTYSSVTIKTNVIDASGTMGGIIQFYDPWYIDFQDDLYRNNWRNRGMEPWRPLHTRDVGSSGWHPDYSTIYPQSPFAYNGVFLNENSTWDPTKPNYLVCAPRVQRFGYYPRSFVGWNASSAQVQCAECEQSAVVFQSPNAEVTANYGDYSYKTLSDTSLINNNQRKLVNGYRAGPGAPTAMHIAWDSAGTIKYASSTDNGQSWDLESAFRDGGDLGRHPSLDTYFSWEEQPAIAFQNFFGGGNPDFWLINVVFRRPEDWTGYYVGGEQYQGSLPAKPVLALPFLFFLQSGGPAPGYYFNIASWSTGFEPYFYLSSQRVPSDMSNNVRNLSAIRSFYHGDPAPWVRVDTVHLAWEEYGVIKYRRVVGSVNQQPSWGNIELVSQDLFGGTNGKPSIVVDYTGRPSIVWEFVDAFEDGDSPTGMNRQIRHRRREAGGWGVTTAFVQSGRDYSNPSISRHATSATSNNLALVWETDQNKMRATTFTNAWQGVLELPEPGRSPSAIGYQEVGAQMFAFTGFYSSRPIGASAYPTFSPPAEDEDSYAEGVVGFDEETISFIIGATEVETGGGTGSKTNGRRIRWKRTAETMVFEDIEGLQQALVSEPFEIQTGEAVSSYAWFRIITPDSLSRWPKGGMFEIKLNLVSADSGKILAPLGQFLVKKGQIPKFRGRKSIVYEGRQASAQLRVALRVLGGMRVKPSLVVYRQADAMPDDSLSTTPLPSSLARAGLPVSLPTEFAVHPNYPNPFNPSTQIKFDLPENSTVTLIVYDVLGRKVAELAEGHFEAGYHSATWNAEGVSSGVYFARFIAKDASGSVKLNKVTKLLLTK